MLYKERTPKTNLRGSQSGGYLLSHNIPQCSTIGDAVSLPCALSAALAPLRSAALRSLPRQRAAHTPHGSLRAHTAARPAPLMYFSQPNDHPSLMTT